MKSLGKVRDYLTELILELSKLDNETYNDFFIKVKELVDTNQILKEISTLSKEGDNEILYIKPLDTSINYEYLEDKFLGIYITHKNIEDDKGIYPLGLNTKGESELIEYIKSKLTPGNFYHNEEEYEEFIKELNLPFTDLADCLIKLCNNTDFNGFSKVSQIIVNGNKLEKTIYFEELNTLITITGGDFDSWGDDDWDNPEYFFSFPCTEINFRYKLDV